MYHRQSPFLITKNSELQCVVVYLFLLKWSSRSTAKPNESLQCFTMFIVFIMHLFFVDTTKTRKEHHAWKEWRASELERDIQYCHPRWPQEAQYVNAEIKAVRSLSLMSGSYWIYFDWVALVLILATITSHVVFFHNSCNLSKKIHQYITMPLLLVLWLRIFKYARPFESAGPFIVIFSNVIGDIAKWAFLNLVIVIPFTCAFWITFGAISLNPVDGYNHVGPLLYNMFSMMVVNGHGFENLESANPFMARLLCGSFIAISAIVMLNLLIALLTNTFERLYENAIANAVMQRAQTILLLQKSLRQKQKSRYYNFIKEKASPEVISRNLGRLMTMDNDEATIERVRDDVREIMNILGEQFGKKFRKGKKSDSNLLQMDICKVQRAQELILADVKNMKLLFEEIKLLLENSATSKTTLTTIDTTDSTNDMSRFKDNKENDSDDEINTSNEDTDDENRKKNISNSIDITSAKGNTGTERSNKNNYKRKIDIKNISKFSDTSNETMKRKLEKAEHKSRREARLKNGQTKFKNVKHSTETGSSQRDSDDTWENEITEDDKSSEKVQRKTGENKGGRKSSERDYQNRRKLGRKKISEKYFKPAERSLEMSFDSEEEVTRQRVTYSPHYMQAPLDNAVDDYDMSQQRLTYLPEHINTPSTLRNVPNLVGQQTSAYATGQPQMSLPDMWKYTYSPYNPISQPFLSNTHDKNQFVYALQQQQGSSTSIPMQNQLKSEVINSLKLLSKE